MGEPAEAYGVYCHRCQARFDAAEAPWCACLVTERTIVCPACGSCFCKAPTSYKQRFWSQAPGMLWERKFEEHSARGGQSRPEPGELRRPLVLVVEDERDIQRLASRAIESLGYGLLLGRNASEGLELVRRYRPDLVLSDNLMAKMDGREMCRRIKSDPSTAMTKVVVVTAFPPKGERADPVDDYLAKPLDLAVLRTVLARHLA